MFKTLRIMLLLLVLVNVALGGWLARVRTTSWEVPLRVMIYPINGDGAQGTQQYIASLQRETFKPVVDFLNEEGQRHGVPNKDLVQIQLGSEVHALPPEPPYGGNVLRVMAWSLSLRWWAWRHAQHEGLAEPHVRLFVLLYDPDAVQKVAHSLGLQKGLLGVVHAFASRAQSAQNNVVIAHELLHTLGATDKYDPANNQPIFPEGYADPHQSPLLPQRLAELMAGRVALSQEHSEMPASLEHTLIGDSTAREIGWAP